MKRNELIGLIVILVVIFALVLWYRAVNQQNVAPSISPSVTPVSGGGGGASNPNPSGTTGSASGGNTTSSPVNSFTNPLLSPGIGGNSENVTPQTQHSAPTLIPANRSRSQLSISPSPH